MSTRASRSKLPCRPPGNCVNRVEAFRCTGQASKIRPIRLETMVQRYLSGELKAITQ